MVPKWVRNRSKPASMIGQWVVPCWGGEWAVGAMSIAVLVMSIGSAAYVHRLVLEQGAGLQIGSKKPSGEGLEKSGWHD